MIWGYDEITKLMTKSPHVRTGIIVDTNILVSATYELDEHHDESVALLEQLISNAVPLFCNVNIRSEFLEIHRRILFSEAILEVEREIDKTHLPAKLAALLTQYRAKYERRFKSEKAPRGLSEAEIKEFKLEMVRIATSGSDLWTELCHERIGSRLAIIWADTKEVFCLNFLGAKDIENGIHFTARPRWKDVVSLMSEEGLSSSDAMILNMFYNSKFSAIASSDTDIGLSVKRRGDRAKMCILPKSRKTLLP